MKERKLQVTQANITRLQHQINRMKLKEQNECKENRIYKKKYDKLVQQIKYQKHRAKLPETKEILDKILKTV